MPEEEDVDGSQPAGVPECTFAEFFEAKPTNVIFRIVDAIPLAIKGGPSPVGLTMPKSESFFAPAIQLWCDSQECDGVRTFDPEERRFHVAESDEEPRERFVTFQCRNCRRAKKKYAILYGYGKDHKMIEAIKLGEIPPLSQRIPSRLRKLVGTDQEKFDKGLRSEAHSLGVGAFAYYRQVVEHQKDRLINEIIKVAKLKSPSLELINELEAAKRQTQFSTAIEEIRQAIPEVLLIQGHNPLSLLYKALSEGLHAGTDGECLEIAQDIRVVLSEFSDRLDGALKDDQTINKAVSSILNRLSKP